MNAGDDLSDGGGQLLLSHTAMMFYHPARGDRNNWHDNSPSSYQDVRAESIWKCHPDIQSWSPSGGKPYSCQRYQLQGYEGFLKCHLPLHYEWER